MANTLFKETDIHYTAFDRKCQPFCEQSARAKRSGILLDSPLKQHIEGHKMIKIHQNIIISLVRLIWFMEMSLLRIQTPIEVLHRKSRTEVAHRVSYSVTQSCMSIIERIHNIWNNNALYDPNVSVYYNIERNIRTCRIYFLV